MAPRILIFSIAMDADYSFELDFIETKDPIFGHDNLFFRLGASICIQRNRSN